MLRKTWLGGAVSVVAVGLGCHSASAASLLTFVPNSGANTPEINFDYEPLSSPTPRVQSGPGMGNLQVTTPLTVPNAAAYGGTVNLDGSTTFSGVSMELSGLYAAENGVASSLIPTTSLTLLSQSLGLGGSFTFRTVDPDGGGAAIAQDLLVGLIGSGVIFGVEGTGTGSILSGDVTYVSGMLFQELQKTGGSATGGEFSISLSNVSPLLFASEGELLPFQADATGQFSSVPEPMALGAAGLGALLLLRRRAR